MKKYVIKIFVVVFIVFVAIALYFYPQLSIATGYAAKGVCTCTFAAGRLPADIQQQDLHFSILKFVTNDVDDQSQQVTSTFMGMSPQTAVFRHGLGCILVHGKDDYNVKFPQLKDTVAQQVSWPINGTDELSLTNGTDIDALNKAIDKVFDPNGGIVSKRTSTVIVIHNDTIVAERYASTFNEHTVQLGWSMTKSWMNTFAGLLVKDELTAISKDHLFADWKGDDRKDLTLHNLLQMNSGLDWDEEYAKVSDATKMLYNSEDVSQIPMSNKLTASRGTFWEYSSGTSNLLSKYFRNTLNDDDLYLSYLKKNLFDKIGMTSAFVECDESGTLIGSSYGYATAKDWARYGLLYLHNGIWNDVRILPVGWTTYTQTEAVGSNGGYSAQFWLNKNGVAYPDAPYDLYSANGFNGQHVFIIPSRNVVIVRLGLSDDGFDKNLFLKEVLAALPTPQNI